MNSAVFLNQKLGPLKTFFMILEANITFSHLDSGALSDKKQYKPCL